MGHKEGVIYMDLSEVFDSLRALRFGFPTTSSQILGYDSFTSELFEIMDDSSLWL